MLVDDEGRPRLIHGHAISTPESPDGPIRMMSEDGELLAIGYRTEDGSAVQPKIVLAPQPEEPKTDVKPVA